MKLAFHNYDFSERLFVKWQKRASTHICHLPHPLLPHRRTSLTKLHLACMKLKRGRPCGPSTVNWSGATIDYQTRQCLFQRNPSAVTSATLLQQGQGAKTETARCDWVGAAGGKGQRRRKRGRKSGVWNVRGIKTARAKTYSWTLGIQERAGRRGDWEEAQAASDCKD